jgi:hypothetical protein
VFDAVEGALCAVAFANAKKITRVVTMQRRENLRIVPKLNELFGSVLSICFKLLIGLPWHAFPPEVAVTTAT